ncbi:MAG: hypothetical protein U9Q78_09365 [Chloroflexota bacterium]|nr:hypothetical protein [Chloroflexota bacterium]
MVDNSQSRSIQPVGEIRGSRTVGQTFVASHDELSRVDVQLATYARRNTQPVIFHLRSAPSASTDIATIAFEAEEVRDNAYRPFRFSPITDSEGRSFYFFLESPTSEPGDAITMWHSPDDVYEEGELYINGRRQGGDLAFRTYYNYTLEAMTRDVWNGVASNWRLILVAALMFTIPGHVLFVLLLPRYEFDLTERLIVSIGLSLAFMPLALLFCTLAGIRLDGTAIWGMMAICGGISLISIIRGVVRRRRLTVGIKINHVALFAILTLSLIARLLPTRGWAVAPGSDSYHHTLIAQLIVERGGLPNSYKPYAPLASFTYHFGFHSAAAFLHWLSGIGIAKSVLVVGQTLSALSLLSAFFFAERLLRSKAAGLSSALVVGLFSVFPAYYTNWGRFPQLTGLVILPIALVLAIEGLDRRAGSTRYLAAAGIALAGLFLTHYRVLIFYLSFMAVYLLCSTYASRSSAKATLRIWLQLLAIGFLALALTWPWLQNLLNHLSSASLALAAYKPSREFFSMKRLEEGAISFYSNYPLMVLSIVGAIWGLLKRERLIIVLCLWVVVLLLISNPYWVNLPGVGLADTVTVVMSLFFPASIAIGFLAASIERVIPKTQLLIGALIVALAFWGFGRMLTIVDPSNVYVKEADKAAMEWIRKNTREDAKFLVPSVVYLNLVIGLDAGYWMPLLAGRSTTAPPMIYPMERSAQKGFAAEAISLSEASSTPDAKETLRVLREKGVTHVYIGKRGSKIYPKSLMDNPNYQLIYHRDGTWIFEVNCEGANELD